MANTNLTVDMITKEALDILHQKLTFVGSINTQYDNSFAQSGAKVGSTLRIREPNQFTVRSGATIDVQDITETNTTLEVSSQKGVDFTFSSEELTLDIDMFSERYLEPAMARLAAEIESDALTNMTKDVYQIIDNDAAAISFLNFTDAGAKLSDSLTPYDSRTALLSNTAQSKVVNALKGLFNDPKEVSTQYREGTMGKAAGFNFASSSHVSDHTTGTAAKSTGYTVNGATEDGSTITIQTGSNTFLKGDIVTFAGCYDVHPETKVARSSLKQFVVTADSGASATSLAISPAIVVSGAKQNVSDYPDDSGAVVKVAAGASETINGNLVYHKNAFTLATADLVMPGGVDFASRQVYDGISMRIIRDYDINNDLFPCRIDILYGYKTLRPEFAARVHADG